MNTISKTNIIEIKGAVAGSGKSSTAARLFKTLYNEKKLKNLVILTPTNKTKYEMIVKLKDLDISEEVATNIVKTIRRFKRNYNEITYNGKIFDDELSEWIECKTDKQYILKESLYHYKKIFNIIIDEASMVSDYEMKDLIEHYKIQNLFLVGDSLQFDPIGNNEVQKDAASNENITEWLDQGKNYNVQVNFRIVLNESLRAKDEELQALVDDIKGERLGGNLTRSYIYEGLLTRFMDQTFELSDDDYHICYTNKQCDRMNSLYEAKRWIVKENDHAGQLNINKGEIYTNKVLEFSDIKKQYEDLGRDSKYEDWFKHHFKPAYGVTCHKMQGTTVESENIYIHLEDILGCEAIENIEERLHIFHKFLYVAVTRATSLNQIKIVAYTTEDDGKIILHNLRELYDNTNSNNPKLANKCLQLREVFSKTFNLPALIDTTVDKETSQLTAETMYFSAREHKEVIKEIVDRLNFSEDLKLKGEEVYNNLVKAAHSIKHKQHKQHKQHEHKQKVYPIEWYEMTKTMTAREWAQATGKSVTLYYKLKEK